MAIPLYTGGQWTEVEDPTGDEADTSGELARLGYDRAAFIGGTDDHGEGVAVEVWRAPYGGRPEFLLFLEIGSVTDTIGASSAVDVMDLLARWAPVALAAERTPGG